MLQAMLSPMRLSEPNTQNKRCLRILGHSTDRSFRTYIWQTIKQGRGDELSQGGWSEQIRGRMLAASGVFIQTSNENLGDELAVPRRAKLAARVLKPGRRHFFRCTLPRNGNLLHLRVTAHHLSRPDNTWERLELGSTFCGWDFDWLNRNDFPTFRQHPADWQGPFVSPTAAWPWTNLPSWEIRKGLLGTTSPGTARRLFLASHDLDLSC